MIRVLYIIDGLHGGGKERQLVELLRIFSKSNDFLIGVITFSKNKHYSKTVKILAPFFVELRKRPTRLEPFISIWWHILRFKPDIIHTWDSLASLYSWLPIKLLSIKYIDGSIRDAGIEKGWQLFLKMFFLRQANLVISNSLAGLSYYKINGYVVYNAIDMKRFHENMSHLNGSMIMVANFTEYKDHYTFIKAAKRLVENGFVGNIYLAGDGPRKESIINYINNFDFSITEKIYFLGLVDNIELYLSNCRYGILCSTSKFGEGVSNSVLEYMAAGLIPIATDIGGTNEIIVNGINGFLINEGDESEIVNLITMLEMNPELRSNIVNNARSTVRSKFSYTENYQKLTTLYKVICNQK